MLWKHLGIWNLMHFDDFGGHTLQTDAAPRWVSQETVLSQEIQWAISIVVGEVDMAAFSDKVFDCISII